MKRLFFCMMVMSIAVGCAKTTVRKDPCACEEGLRFYRSKPYLKIVEAGDKPGMVVMTLEHLPDFSEEYAIQIRAGIGTNQTKVTLNDAGVLTGLDANVDSKFAENLQALASLASAVKPTDRVGAPPAKSAELQPITVAAWQVPNGYYEAVISRLPDGHKQMYGWRYLGFMPFANCPVEMSGMHGMDCDCSMLYGLVNVNGVMMFRQLGDVASSPQHIALTGAVGSPAPGCVSDDDIQAGKSIVAKVLASTDSTLTASNVDIKPNPACEQFMVTVKTKATLDDNQRSTLELTIADKFKSQWNRTAVTVTLNLQKPM